MARDGPETQSSPASPSLAGLPSVVTILYPMPGRNLPTLADFGIPFSDAGVIATAVDISDSPESNRKSERRCESKISRDLP